MEVKALMMAQQVSLGIFFQIFTHYSTENELIITNLITFYFNSFMQLPLAPFHLGLEQEPALLLVMVVHLQMLIMLTTLSTLAVLLLKLSLPLCQNPSAANALALEIQ